MPENPVLGRRMLASNRRINPLVASLAPHDPRLAEQVAGVMLDDIEALLHTVPSKDEQARLPVTEQRMVFDLLQKAQYQLEDARLLVETAREEAQQQ